MAEPMSRDECLLKEKEHRDALQRVHERVDTIDKTASSIEASAKIMSDCVCKMEKVMFGDQNSDGIMTKVSVLDSKVRTQDKKIGDVYGFGYLVISALVVSLIGAVVALIFKR